MFKCGLPALNGSCLGVYVCSSALKKFHTNEIGGAVNNFISRGEIFE